MVTGLKASAHESGPEDHPQRFHRRATWHYSVTQVLSHPVTALAIVAIVWTLPAVASACPGCKDALFEPDQLTLRLSSAKGYALSIGLLLGVPAALAVTVTTLLVRSRRQRRGPLLPPNDNVLF